MRTHYGIWQPCWISNQHQKHKFGRSNEHFWQVWFNSVQWFQRRRFKCEKLTDGRWTLTHDKSSHGLWPGELKTRWTNRQMWLIYSLHSFRLIHSKDCRWTDSHVSFLYHQLKLGDNIITSTCIHRFVFCLKFQFKLLKVSMFPCGNCQK